MIFKFRTGFLDFEEVDLSEEQILDLLDFVLNNNEIYLTPSDSSAIIANLKSGEKLSVDFIIEHRFQEQMQK